MFGLSLQICLLLALAILGAGVVGRAQAVPKGVTQLHLVDCIPPCWLGITPGSTSIADAKAKLVAIFWTQNGFQIRDTAGFPGGHALSTDIDNTIAGADFFLFVRLHISELVDGKSETVQAIDLFQSRGDRRVNVLTVADILGTFGPPTGEIVEQNLNGRYEITLKYTGWRVVFNTNTDRVWLTENPHIYFEHQAAQPSPAEYQVWKGFSALIQNR